MKPRVGLPFRLTLIGAAALFAASFSLPPAPRPAFAEQDDKIDQEDPAEKAADLIRARANGDKSPDRLVVVYDRATATDDPERERVRQSIGGKLLKASKLIKRDLIRVRNGDAEAVAQAVRGLPGVKDAYPDRLAKVSLAVNDPLLSDEWGLAKIQASTAWDTSQGDGVKVAVLDCGIHDSHPDLTGKVVLASNFSTSSNSGDGCNHGTHVAGTIAAVTNNAVGVAAVAPKVFLMNGKVLGDSGSGSFTDVEDGIVWAASNGAKVISMSLGAATSCPSATQIAVNTAWNTYGAVVVAAAGNGGADGVGDKGAEAPGNCANVISVAATNSSDAKPSWSNYGTGLSNLNANVDVAAPGVSILSTVNPDHPENNGILYDYFSGTSMATPHTAAVVALIWKTSYGTSAAAVRDRLFSTADDISGTGTLWVEGRINAAAAVSGGALSQHDVGVTAFTASPTTVVQGNASTLNVTVQNLGTFAESDISVQVTDTTTTTSVGSQVVSSLAVGASTVLNFPWSTSASTPTGSHSFTATSSLTGDENAANNSKSAAVNVQAAILDVAINAISANPSSVQRGNSSTVNVTVGNPGTLIANNINVELVDTTAGSSVETQSVASLAPGATTQLSFTWATNSGTALGNHSLSATATLSGGGDATAANNGKSTTVGVTFINHDVAITNMTGPTSTKIGNKPTIKVYVKNEGAVAESFNVTLVDTTAGTTIRTITVSSLSPGSSKTLSFRWATAGTSLGGHELTATAGPVPNEVDLADNTRSLTVTVNATSTKT